MSRRSNGLLIALAVVIGLYFLSRTQKAQDVIQSVLSRSERNNNPGNIRVGTSWQGIDPQRRDSDFVVFAAPEWGFRAMARILRNYFSRGNTTIREIINTWAPPSENDTSAYVSAVANSVGVSPDTPLDFDTYTPDLLKAIAHHETGYWPTAWSDDVVQKGIELERG